MPGFKRPARLRSYLTEIADYRVVTVQDGVVVPATPPVAALLDLSNSPIGLNTVQIFVEPTVGDATVTLEAWIVVDGVWYFFATAPAAQNLIWTIENVPCGELAIIVTVAAGTVILKASMTN